MIRKCCVAYAVVKLLKGMEPCVYLSVNHVNLNLRRGFGCIKRKQDSLKGHNFRPETTKLNFLNT